MADTKSQAETFIQNILGIDDGKASLGAGELPMARSFFCPLLLLILWIVSLSILGCICVCCKFVKSESFTSYDSDSFELQEVHIVEPTLGHVKGCACLECLHRQLSKEFEQSNGK
ncbi:uncharacterized protein LOC117137370 [Drosophila mauritiana]|uniref:Uncharacterized protein LOC117137370 n=1 Tax=Drosophila mauritiana TaxID=7226 RepID=A0A6P8JPI4_DROMA|nr:uncharacterized protein LOC117137370 [Drosophila mauritiana]